MCNDVSNWIAAGLSEWQDYLVRYWSTPRCKVCGAVSTAADACKHCVSYIEADRKRSSS